MNNIVKRLQGPEGYIAWEHATLMDEAADMIEKLRSAGDGLLNALLGIEGKREFGSVVEAWEDIRHG